MNIGAHTVAPEEIMAFLDGELANDEAQAHALEAHIEQCDECRNVAEKLRATSQSLSAWTVPAIPKSLDYAISAMGEKSPSLSEIPEPGLWIRMSFWSWKRWTLSGVGALATLVIVVGIMVPDLHRSGAKAVHAQHMVRESIAMNDVLSKDRNLTWPPTRPQVIVHNGPASIAMGGGGGGGSRDKLQSADSASAQMITRSVSLSIVVMDFAHARSSLDALLSRHHGYAAQLNASTPENAPRGLSASLRIPAPELDSTTTDLRNLGRVENESQSGEDVTKQHTDLVARLKNSRETEERFRAILEQRAGKIADVLQVEEEIARVRGEIEGMEAEQKALEHRVDFATVDLQLTEEFKAALNPPAPSVATRIHNAFVAGYQSARETLLGILLFFIENGLTILIWLAILAFPVGLVWRRFRRVSAAV